MERDIFDLSDLSDLPKELKNELSVNKRSDFEKNIIELFKIIDYDTKGLSINQIQVAYYRKYKEYKDRRTIVNKLYNMSRSINFHIIEKVKGKNGIYRMVK